MKTIQITDSQHQALKIRAAQEGRTMGEIIHRLIDDHLGRTVESAAEAAGRLGLTGPVTLVETAIVKEPPTPEMRIRRKMPDLSKQAQVKGKMGR